MAAAGLDVFASEPCTDSPLFELENVVATPHLGASTDEAQEKAGISVARSVRLALAGELVPDAVNVQGGVIAEDVRPGIPLTEKLGRVFTGLAGEVAQQVDVEVRGEITDYDVKVLELAALKGIFADIVEEQVSYVNAPLLAAERGTAVRLVADPESPDHRNLITIRGTLADGSQVSVSGTLVGIDQRERLVEVNGFDVDLEPTEHLAFLTYADRPGMVGTVGGILGDAGVNIAGMQVSRQTPRAARPWSPCRSTPPSPPTRSPRSSTPSTPRRCARSTWSELASWSGQQRARAVDDQDQADRHCDHSEHLGRTSGDAIAQLVQAERRYLRLLRVVVEDRGDRGRRDHGECHECDQRDDRDRVVAEHHDCCGRGDRPWLLEDPDDDRAAGSEVPEPAGESGQHPGDAAGRPGASTCARRRRSSPHRGRS